MMKTDSFKNELFDSKMIFFKRTITNFNKNRNYLISKEAKSKRRFRAMMSYIEL